MSTTAAPVNDLLRRTHAGDRAAFESLLVRELPYIRERVHRRLGPALRARAETGDLVQDALVRILEHGPRFLVSNDAHLRALLARIVENVIRDGVDHASALRRGRTRERAIEEDDSVLVLDPPAESPTRPSVAAARNEERAWIPLALELLDHDDRRVLVLREWDGLSHADIAADLGVTEDAARMRFGRALARLARAIEALRSGRVHELLSEDAP
jgi:RNA polymerase sigma-70 factor (ECF subfamily)